MNLKALASNPVACMIGGSAASCLAAIAATGSSMTPELVLGMAGPLASAVVTWHVMERTHASAPERLTGVMIAAFLAKVLLVGGYVVVMLAVVGLRPQPFMVTFTGYYVALHFVEALFLRRLLADGLRTPWLARTGATLVTRPSPTEGVGARNGSIGR
jgi:hypothetical protein